MFAELLAKVGIYMWVCGDGRVVSITDNAWELLVSLEKVLAGGQGCG